MTPLTGAWPVNRAFAPTTTPLYYFGRNSIDSCCFIILKTVNGELNFVFSEDVIDYL